MRVFFLVVFGLASIYLKAQETFEIFVDAKQLPEGSYLEVSFILKNGEGSDFQLPDLSDFKIVSGPSRSSSTSYINGVKSSELIYTYLLQPKKSGTLSIGSASIKVGNRTLTTKPVTISVLGKNEIPTQPEDAELTFIKAEVNATNAFVGQQVVINYKLYTRENIDHINILEEPDYKGFYVQELNRFDGRVVREIYKGHQYYTKVLRSVAIFPQQAGRFEISPMVLQLAVAERDEQSPFGGGFFYSPPRKKLNRSTNSLVFQINPLPDQMPDDFIGAIGKYDVQTLISGYTITTDEMIQLRIIVEGDGDIKRVIPPALTFSDQFQGYPVKILEESSFELDGKISGKKIFEYTFLPKAIGIYPVQLSYSYFDTETKSYKTILADPFQVVVKNGNLTNDLEGQVEGAIAEKAETIKSIKTAPKLTSNRILAWGDSTFILLGFFPFLILLGSFVFQRYTLNGNIAAKNSSKIARQRLKVAESYKHSKQPALFYNEITKAMSGYLNDKLGIPNSSLTKEEIALRLEKLDISNAQIDRFKAILVECEKALYSGMDNAAQMDFTYFGAVDILSDIEQALQKINGRK
jgi:hypothetical protein